MNKEWEKQWKDYVVFLKGIACEPAVIKTNYYKKKLFVVCSSYRVFKFVVKYDLGEDAYIYNYVSHVNDLRGVNVRDGDMYAVIGPPHLPNDFHEIMDRVMLYNLSELKLKS